jgi:hypothetical protein
VHEFAELWLAGLKKQPTTRARYRQALAHVIGDDRLGNLQMTKLRPQEHPRPHRAEPDGDRMRWSRSCVELVQRVVSGANGHAWAPVQNDDHVQDRRPGMSWMVVK